MGNNPVNYVDPTGHVPNSIVTLDCRECVGGVGHVGAIIVDSEKAYYYSFAPDAGDAAYPWKWVASDFKHEVLGSADLSTDELIAMVNDKFRGKEKGGFYDRAVEFADQSGEQIRAAQTAIEGFDGKKYNVLTNNCLDAVKSALGAAGYSWGESPGQYFDYVPNIWTGWMYLEHRDQGAKDIWVGH